MRSPAGGADQQAKIDELNGQVRIVCSCRIHDFNWFGVHALVQVVSRRIVAISFATRMQGDLAGIDVYRL